MVSLPIIVGWIGTAVTLAAYIMVTFGKITGESSAFRVMNLFGAIALGINLYFERSWPSFVLELVWGVVAVWGLVFGGKQTTVPNKISN